MNSGADPGIFVRGGGPTFREKMTKKPKNNPPPQKKKKNPNNNKRGEGGRFSIYSAFVWSKSNLATETAFMTITFHKYDIPQCFRPTKTHSTSLF